MDKLFQDSGSTPEQRRAEADKICAMLDGQLEQMTPIESNFVERVGDSDYPISPKQLFWLRDIKEKYL